MKEYSFHQSALQAQLLTACGIRTIIPENCKEISVQIFNKEKNYLSKKNAQRFFGLIQDIADPSQFVLDSLARFTGNKSWDQFKKQFIEQKPSPIHVQASKWML